MKISVANNDEIRNTFQTIFQNLPFRILTSISESDWTLSMFIGDPDLKSVLPLVVSSVSLKKWKSASIFLIAEESFGSISSFGMIFLLKTQKNH